MIRRGSAEAGSADGSANPCQGQVRSAFVVIAGVGQPAARISAGGAVQCASHASRRRRVRARLQDGARRHRVEAAGLELPLRSHQRMARVREPGSAGAGLAPGCLQRRGDSKHLARCRHASPAIDIASPSRSSRHHDRRQRRHQHDASVEHRERRAGVVALSSKPASSIDALGWAWVADVPS